MPMTAEEIEELIKNAMPDAVIEIKDLRGDGDHYQVYVESRAFTGLPRVRQHQLVYEALQGRVGGVLHALALMTAAPARQTQIKK